MLRTLIAAVCLVAARLAWAGDPWGDLTIRPDDVVGTLSCAAASCHGSRQPRLAGGTVKQQEYVHWLGVSPRFGDGRRHYDPRALLEDAGGDPHALAGWRMLQPRFQEVLRRASQRPDGSVDDGTAMRCARCHDPFGRKAASADSANAEYSAPSTQYSAPQTSHTLFGNQGIGCESCHGGGRRWLSVHYEYGVGREELAELGMIDTKNLLIRARVCAGCHVGSSANDMNHDMIAAGHPPLRFEQASYEALIKHKHWNDHDQRLAIPDYELQLWAAGRLAAADAALELLASRAGKEAEQESQVRGQASEGRSYKSWPEFSEMNCFACHQALRSPQADRFRRGGAGSFNPSALGWQSWNVALVDALFPKSNAIGQIKLIRQNFERSLMPDAAEVARHAVAARDALRREARLSWEGLVLESSGEPFGPEAVLKAITFGERRDTWDALCQRLATVAAARRSLADRGLTMSKNVDQRMERLAGMLRFSGDGRKYPLYFEVSEIQREAWQLEVARLADSLMQLEQEARRGRLPEVLP